MQTPVLSSSPPLILTPCRSLSLQASNIRSTRNFAAVSSSRSQSRGHQIPPCTLLSPILSSRRSNLRPTATASGNAEPEGITSIGGSAGDFGEDEAKQLGWVEVLTNTARKPATGLVIAWVGAWSGLAAHCAFSSDLTTFASRSTASMAVIALVWMGMVLAVSFLEAWVKFQAPLLTRPVAVDVGRHVFGMLNLVEIIHSTFLAFVATYARAALTASAFWRSATDAAAASGMANTAIDVEIQELAMWNLTGSIACVPICWILLLLVLIQKFWVLPKLDLLARRTIALADADDIPMSRVAVQETMGEDEGKGTSRVYHKMYGVLELAKVVLLIVVAGWSIGLFEV